MFRALIESYLVETPAPSDLQVKTWYHGTTLEAGQSISKEGFLRAPKPKRGLMDPMKDSVYITSDLKEALGYAFFRSGSHLEYPKEGATGFCALIVIDGQDLSEVNPDEDTIADLIPDYVKTESGEHKYPWLVSMAKAYAPKEYEKYQRYGDYRYGIALGKKLVRHLTDGQRLKLIEASGKLAHLGQIPVEEVWKIPLSEVKFLQQNPEDFRLVGERI